MKEINRVFFSLVRLWKCNCYFYGGFAGDWTLDGFMTFDFLISLSFWNANQIFSFTMAQAIPSTSLKPNKSTAIHLASIIFTRKTSKKELNFHRSQIHEKNSFWWKCVGKTICVTIRVEETLNLEQDRNVWNGKKVLKILSFSVFWIAIFFAAQDCLDTA
jgi:hypothetical protein